MGGEVKDPFDVTLELLLDVEKSFVWFEPQTFLMGAQDDDPMANQDEKPRHEVEITRPFGMCRWVTTNQVWAQFVRETGFAKPSNWEGQGERLYAVGMENHPVTCVSLLDCMQSFLPWLNGKAEKAGLKVRFDLPTEAEWELAAGGGVHKFPWGNEEPTPNHANYGMVLSGLTTVVGSYPLGATPQGLYDMAGNTWEWCKDRRRVYTKKKVVDPGLDAWTKGDCG